MKRFSSLVALLLLAGFSAGCSFSISTANITQAVLAKDVKSDTFEPVDPTSTFPTDQAVINLVVTVANAPSGTKVKTVWTAVDVGDAAPANTKIDEAEVTMDAAGNAHFTLSAPNSGVWPVGKYKVEVYLNDKLDRTLEYTVAQ
jgi:PBP1b-binding outer membrane lipoprotein LpoB